MLYLGIYAASSQLMDWTAKLFEDFSLIITLYYDNRLQLTDFVDANIGRFEFKLARRFVYRIISNDRRVELYLILLYIGTRAEVQKSGK